MDAVKYIVDVPVVLRKVKGGTVEVLPTPDGETILEHTNPGKPGQIHLRDSITSYAANQADFDTMLKQKKLRRKQ